MAEPSIVDNDPTDLGTGGDGLFDPAVMGLCAVVIRSATMEIGQCLI